MIAFLCPKCHSQLRFDEAHAGKSVSCPACGQLVVPSAAANVAWPETTPPVVRPAAGVVASDSDQGRPGDGSLSGVGDWATVPPSPPPADSADAAGKSTRCVNGAASLVGGPGDPQSGLATVAPAAAVSTIAASHAVPGYEILGELGRGGMGVVYKARHLQLGRTVALKMILAGGHAGEAHLARFRTEAQAVARLQHANIVQVHEVGEHDGKPYFSLEFCEGGSLDRKTAGNPQPPAQAAKLMETLARAMHAAHQARVIHRDLKPANVLLAADGTPKITDFGLAKKLDEAGQTHTGDVMGTPSYMAPEQAEGKKDVGPAADVYALGAILYELLTGRPPFKAATMFDTIIQVVSEEPVPPRQLNAQAPADLETICLKCLRKEPARRYATAEELAEDLRRFQAGEAILARPAGWRERGWKWVRRNPAVAALLAAVAVLLVAGTTISALFAVDARNQARIARDRAEDADRERKNAEQSARREKELAGKEATARANAEQSAKREKDLAGKEAAARTNAEKLLKDVAAEKENVKKELAKMEFVAYAYRLREAQAEIERGRLENAEAVLRVCDLKLQGWEHDYLLRQTQRAVWTGSRHTGVLRSVAYNPDGKRIVSGGGLFGSGEVKVWDAATGQEILSLKGHTNAVTSVAYSPDGKRIVSGSVDNTVKVWDAATGREVLSIKGAFSPVAYSPDGKRIVSSSWDATVKVWDAATGQEALSLKGHTGAVTSVAYSPDGKRIVSAGSYDKTVKVWDAAMGQEILSLTGHTHFVTSVAYSPDGKHIVSGSWDKTVKVWDAATGQLALSLKGHTGAVLSVAYGPDGKRIVSGSWDATVKMWDAATGQEAFSLKGHTATVVSVAYSPDGKRIVSGSNDLTVRVWDAATGQGLSLKGHTNIVNSVAYSPDGKRIVSGAGAINVLGAGAINTPGEVKVWDAATGQKALSLKGHAGAVYSVAYSPDGKRIVSGSSDTTVKVWDAATGREVLSIKGAFSPVAYSPDGKRIVSGSVDNTVKVWDAATGREVLSIKGAFSPVAYSPDGKRIVSSSWDATVKVWDAATGQEALSLKGHTGAVTSVAYSPDGKRIVSAGLDRTMKVWDVATGQEALSLKGHTGAVTSVAFSPDGKCIVSGSGDNTVKVWDATTGQEALSLKGHTGAVTSVAFSRDGKRIVSGSHDNTLKVWDASRAAEKRGKP